MVVCIQLMEIRQMLSAPQTRAWGKVLRITAGCDEAIIVVEYPAANIYSASGCWTTALI